MERLAWANKGRLREVAQRLQGSLRGGALIGFPSESSYGLGVEPFVQGALQRLLALKRARGLKPFPLILSEPGSVERVASTLPGLFAAAARAFWPGPLSLLVQAHPELSEALTGGSGRVAVRVPGHAAARWAAAQAGGVLTATSANRSGRPALSDPDALMGELGAELDWLLAAGPTEGGSPSTLVDLDATPLRLLREGPISREQLESALGRRVVVRDREAGAC